MKCKWLIEDVFAEDTAPLFKALDELGIEYNTQDRINTVLRENYGCKGEECVVFYGCLDSAKAFRRNSKSIPGAYFNLDAYRCCKYYPVFGDYLLNSDYMMIPYGELYRQKELLYDKFGEDRAIFIRPDVGDKVFTGKLVYKEHFDKDIKLLGFYDVEPSELCVVSYPKNIVREWRFVVVNGKVITGSLYKENNTVGSEATYTDEAFALADKLCKLYQPDRCWTIDICETKSDLYKLLEIGCFSCAGLYKCDRKLVVEAVTKAAIEEWNEYNTDVASQLSPL